MSFKKLKLKDKDVIKIQLPKSRAYFIILKSFKISPFKWFDSFSAFFFFFFFFLPCVQHTKVPRPGREPEPQWQHWILNSLNYHQGTPYFLIFEKESFYPTPILTDPLLCIFCLNPDQFIGLSSHPCFTLRKNKFFPLSFVTISW